MPNAFTTHEFRRYSDILQPETPPSSVAAPAGDRALALDPALASTSSLCTALDALAEVVAARLNAFAAFIILTDGTTQHLLAGSWRDKHDSDDPDPPPTPQWLAPTPADRTAWLHLLRLTIGLNDDDPNNGDHNHRKQNRPADTGATGHPITRRRLADDTHTAHLTCVTGAPQLRRFAAAPIVSARGIAIGAVFTVNTESRMFGGERNTQSRLLHATAAKAMAQLEAARAVRLRERLSALHARSKSFIKFKDVVAQLSQEPPTAHKHQGDASELHREQELGEEDIVTGGELKSSDEGEAGALRRNDDNVEHAISVSVDNDGGGGEGSRSGKRGSESTEGETTYRKVFSRAAEGLRCGLDVDGVTFLNGLVGFHGLTIPIGESEIELESEMDAQSTDCQNSTGAGPENDDVEGGQSLQDGSMAPPPNKTAASRADDMHRGGERTFTSTAYERDVIAQRPAECLGISVVHDKWPIVKHVASSTVGLKYLSEGFLQVLLRRFPDGNLWYFGEDGTPYTFSPDDDSLVSVADDTDVRHVSKSFPGVRQLFFAPLTDPTTLKRLAGCLAWTTRITPVFTVAADLDMFRGFLSSVESEVSRIDAIAAVKQQEAFVSSVSHELRTPLHGVLGAVEFLTDTHLDDFQYELAETIRSCSSTLHDTLSSVLAYAKINQFERRRDKPIKRLRGATQPSPWAMEGKDLGRETADTQGTLYCAAELATLCEGVVDVTASGYAFSSETCKKVNVVLNIVPRPHWTFITEPAIFRRIITNILGNALKYTDSGFVRVSMRVDDTQDDPTQLGVPNDDGTKLLILTVADSGKGIGRNFLQKHLFSPFTQEDAVASEGVGLGMSIVKSMVGLLGGKIRVASTPGEGTTFTVSIPMQECAEDVIQTSEPSAALAEALPRIQKHRRTVAIWGFEDNMLRESLVGYFRDWFRWDVVHIGDGQPRADVVVVDGTGDAAATAIHKRPDARAYLFLAALEKPTRSKRRNSVAVGRHSVIEVTTTRPIGPLKLCKAVSTCLARLAEMDQGKMAYEVDTSTAGSRHRRRHDMSAGDAELEPKSPPQSRSPPTPPPVQETRPKTASPSPSSPYTGRPPDVVPSPLPERPHRPPPPLPAPPPETTTSSSHPPPPPSSSSTAKQEDEEQQQQEQPRLLLVEDNAVNLKLLQTFLRKQGYTDLTAAENGRIAVDAVTQLGKEGKGFDVIFMDISMPVMDGFAATLAIRGFERERGEGSGEGGQSSTPLVSLRPPAYIVALTGLAGTRDEERAYAAGMDLVLTKPVRFKGLNDVLGKWAAGERVFGGVKEEDEEGNGRGKS